MKEQAEATIPWERELKEIYQFYQFLSELPERIKRIMGGKSLSFLLPYLLNKLKERREEAPCEEVSTFSKMVSDELKQFALSYYQNLFPFRLSKEELERMEQKWDELQDWWDFSDWFFSKYPQCDEWFKDEYHNSYIMLIEYLQKQLKAGEFDLDILYYPLPKEDMEDLISIIKDHREAYEIWINTASVGERYADTFIGEEFNPLHACFISYHLFTELNFQSFFQLMQNQEGQLALDDYRLIYNRLREKGIDRYVQQRYDEYRSLMPGAEDLRFSYTPRAEEVYQALGKYINTGNLLGETICYFQDLIDKVLPGLTNRNQAIGFIRLLWLDDRHFNESKKGEKKNNKAFVLFRDEAVKAFHLTHLGDFKDYTAGQEQVLKSSVVQWEKHPELFQSVVTKNALTGKKSAQTLLRSHNISSKE